MNPTLPGIRLIISVPPQLEAAVAYHGEARFFAIFWQPAGDEAMVTDGRVTHDGCWWGYQALVDHPAITLPLALTGHRYDLGSSETDAKYWLVIDRETRTAAIAPVQEAKRFLEAQYPPLPKIDLTSEQWSVFVQRLEQIARQATAEAASAMANFDPMAALAKQNAVVAEMRQWLNAQLPAGWQGRLGQLIEDIASEPGDEDDKPAS